MTCNNKALVPKIGDSVQLSNRVVYGKFIKNRHIYGKINIMRMQVNCITVVLEIR